ncbi:ribokinase [Spirochaetia bacterium]|nr:ribokinase [Spirochaetia bacterium]
MHDILYLSLPVCDINVVLSEPLPLFAGRTNRAYGISIVPGGGANTLFMASRMGLDIVAMGVVGADAFGRIIIEGYQREGVDTGGIECLDGYTTLGVVVLNDPQGNHGFASMLDGRFVQTINTDALLAETRVVCLSGYMFAVKETQEKTLAFMRKAKALHKTVFFDPGPLAIEPELVPSILALTDVLVLTGAEAAQLAGGLKTEDAAKDLAERLQGMVVVKAGERGCYIFSDGTGRWYPGFEVTVLDTTGAGDVFIAAFMRGYIDGWDIESSAALANAAGAATAAKQGTGHSVATVDEVLRVLAGAGHSIPPL